MHTAKYTYKNTDFAETPSSVVVELGTLLPALLRYRHTLSEAIIGWLVNGSSVGQFPDIRSGFINESGNIVSTLIIPAELQYNGTVVECLALYLDGTPSERAPVYVATITSLVTG